MENQIRKQRKTPSSIRRRTGLCLLLAVLGGVGLLVSSQPNEDAVVVQSSIEKRSKKVAPDRLKTRSFENTVEYPLVKTNESNTYSVSVPEEAVAKRSVGADPRHQGSQIDDDSPVLAKVNGEGITVEAVFGVEKEIKEIREQVPPQKFDSLFKKEIERTLVFQQAVDRGIELEDHEVKGLARRQSKSRSSENVVDPIGDPYELREREMRESEAMLLEKKLLASVGIVPPYVTEEQVIAHYEANIDQYGKVPESEAYGNQAWQEISLSIRRELSRSYQLEYDRKRTEFLRDVEDNSEIVHFEIDLPRRK